MIRTWIVFCPHCNTNTTEAIPPKRTAFVPVVRCALCNREIEAKDGHFVMANPRIFQPKYPDLLEVE